MKIAVTGSSGLIGSALVRALTAAGHDVVRLVRRAPTTVDEVQWDPAAGELDPRALAGVDAAVNLAGVSIGARRWSRRQRRAILDSRVAATSVLAAGLARLEPRPQVLVSASAVGYYGDRGEEILTEDSPAGTGFLAEVAARWEGATLAAEDAGIRTAHIRSGLVLDATAPAMRRMLLPFKLALGGRLGTGRQFWSWIALVDEISAIAHILAGDLSGAVNLTAPRPVTNAEFARTLGRVLRRPAVLPVPQFALRALLGGDMAHELLLGGQRALPAKLAASGFEYAHPDLSQALRHALGRPASLSGN